MAGERVRELIPFFHVADVRASICFYEKLGFAVRETYEHEGSLDWAALEADRARLMLAQATAPIDPDQQAVVFYLYSDDLAGLRARLVAAGVAARRDEDDTPGPRQEMGVRGSRRILPDDRQIQRRRRV
jgi:Glyoxalase/Bleomycin resistance protein/Dioxygenase superfamily